MIKLIITDIGGVKGYKKKKEMILRFLLIFNKLE